jgi:hypothetical protein
MKVVERASDGITKVFNIFSDMIGAFCRNVTQ